MQLTSMVICSILFFLPVSSLAATYHVAKTGSNNNSCAAAQSPSTPKLTIQEGVNCATAGGDIVAIHTGTYTEAVNVPNSGASGNPIRIQPFGYTNDGCGTVGCGSGDAVTWQSSAGNTMLTAFNKNYIRVQGLRFINSTSHYVLWFENYSSKSTSPMQGLEVLNNTFTNNGTNGSGGDMSVQVLYSKLGLTSGTSIVNKLNGNTFTNNWGFNLVNAGSSNTEVRNNVTTGQKGSYNGSTSLYSSGLIDEFAPGGVFDERNIYDGNNYSNAGAHSLPFEMSGIRCDSSANRPGTTTYSNNIIHDLSPGVSDLSFSQQSYGMFFEAGCSNILVTGNIIYNIGLTGIQVGSDATGGPTGGTVEHNTLYECGRSCIHIRASNGVTYRNNILSSSGGSLGAGQSEVVGVSGAGGAVVNNTFRNNLYFNPNTTTINHWRTDDPYPYFFAEQTLAQWNTSSGETGSKNANPLFVNPGSDFHLQATSPAKSAGNDGLDMGAYPQSGPTSPLPAPTNVRILDP